MHTESDPELGGWEGHAGADDPGAFLEEEWSGGAGEAFQK